MSNPPNRLYGVSLEFPRNPANSSAAHELHGLATMKVSMNGSFLGKAFVVATLAGCSMTLTAACSSTAPPDEPLSQAKEEIRVCDPPPCGPILSCGTGGLLGYTSFPGLLRDLGCTPRESVVVNGTKAQWLQVSCPTTTTVWTVCPPTGISSFMNVQTLAACYQGVWPWYSVYMTTSDCNSSAGSFVEFDPTCTGDCACHGSACYDQ